MVHLFLTLLVAVLAGLQARAWRAGRIGVVVLLALATAVLGAELMAQVWRVTPTWREGPIPNDSMKGIARFPEGFTVPVASDFAPGVRTAWPRPPDDPATRVLFVGDSFTYGQGVADEDVFARVAARALSAPGAPVEAVVHGMSGAGIDLALGMLLDVGLLWSPDVVVWVVIPNDLGDPDLPDDLIRREVTAEGTFALPALWAARRRGLDAARRAHAHYAGRLGDADARRRTRAMFEAGARLTEATGARLVVAYHPLLADPDVYPLDGLRDDLLALAEDAGADTVDLGPALAGRDVRALWVHPQDHHPNADAHALVGARLTDALRPHARHRRSGDACAVRHRPTPVDRAPDHPAARVAACEHATTATLDRLAELHLVHAASDRREVALAAMVLLLRDAVAGDASEEWTRLIEAL